jgi:hypothetical protein
MDGKPASAKSGPAIDGGVKKIPIPDITLHGGNGKPMTTFRNMFILLVKTSDSSTLYFSAETKDDGWRGDVTIKVFLQVDGISIAQYELGVFHAFCGTTPQQTSVGITADQFDITNSIELSFTAPLWKWC